MGKMVFIKKWSLVCKDLRKNIMFCETMNTIGSIYQALYTGGLARAATIIYVLLNVLFATCWSYLFLAGFWSVSSVKRDASNRTKGKYLIEAWGKVVITCGYTDDGQHLWTPGLKYLPKITCEFSAVYRTVQSLPGSYPVASQRVQLDHFEFLLPVRPCPAQNPGHCKATGLNIS